MLYGILIALLVVVALSFLASPLIAVVIALPLALVAIVFLSARRKRTAWEDTESPVTPEGKPTSPTGGRSSGEPASGEGQV